MLNCIASLIFTLIITSLIMSSSPTNQNVTQQTMTSQNQNMANNNIPAQQSSVTYIPYMALQNNTILYQKCAKDNRLCQNFGTCYESLTRPTVRFCRCHMKYHGELCENGESNKYKKVLFGVALLAGIILIFAIASSCQLYMKSGDAKDVKQSYEDLASTVSRYSRSTRTSTLDSRESNLIRPVRPISLSASSYRENDRLRSNGSRSISPSSFYSHRDAYVKDRPPSVLITKPEVDVCLKSGDVKCKSGSDSSYDMENPVFEVEESKMRSETINSEAELIFNDYTGCCHDDDGCGEDKQNNEVVDNQPKENESDEYHKRKNIDEENEENNNKGDLIGFKGELNQPMVSEKKKEENDEVQIKDFQLIVQ